MGKRQQVNQAQEDLRLAINPGTNFMGKGLLPSTQVELEDWYLKYWPAGSGPLQQCRVICAAFEEIARARGYDTDFIQLRATAMRRD